MNLSPIRILVADDHPALRAGLRALINNEPDMEVIAEAENGHDALTAYRRTLPDIALMDLRMPGQGGVEATFAIRAEFPKARIIVNTTHAGDEDIFRAIQSGAQSYLTKDMPKEEIFECIRDVYVGKGKLPTQVEKQLRDRMGRPDLTDRELSTLDCLVKGLSNKEIADILHLSEDAVKSRLKGLFVKLGAQDRTDAVVTALRQGIIHLE
jgi:two-component system NarL family response regulator